MEVNGLSAETQCLHAPAEPARSTEPRARTISSVLRQDILRVLRLRGTTAGAMLLLTDGSPRDEPLTEAASRDLAQFQILHGALAAAPALAEARRFAAVVLVLTRFDASELEHTLRAVAPVLAP